MTYSHKSKSSARGKFRSQIIDDTDGKARYNSTAGYDTKEEADSLAETVLNGRAQQNYAAGKSDGEEIGRVAGRDAGYTAGHTVGKGVGDAKGYKEGLKVGVPRGRLQGVYASIIVVAAAFAVVEFIVPLF